MPDLNATGGEPDTGLRGSDPTALTTDALNREVANLHDEIEGKIKERARATDDLKELVQAKLDGEVRVMEERIRSIHAILEINERVRLEQKADTKAGVEAALASAKEAVSKSEAATAKQIDQMAATFTAALTGVTSTIADTKERVSELAATKRGGKEMLAGIYALAGFIVALIVIGGLVAAAGGFSQ